MSKPAAAPCSVCNAADAATVLEMTDGLQADAVNKHFADDNERSRQLRRALILTAPSGIRQTGNPIWHLLETRWATSCGVMRKRSIPHSFEEQLAFEKRRLEEKAMHLLDGSSKDEVLKKIAQLNTAIHINEWLRSPGLQPPK